MTEKGGFFQGKDGLEHVDSKKGADDLKEVTTAPKSSTDESSKKKKGRWCYFVR